MTSTVPRRLLIMMRVHRRAQFLPEIFKQIWHLIKPRADRTAHVVVMYDRPTGEVLSAMAQIATKLPSRITLTEISASAPVLSASKGDRFIASLPEMFACRDGTEDVGILWDDDLLMTAKGMFELRAHMELLQHDLLIANWLHVWDEERTEYNSRFPRHTAVWLFRILPGDDFSRTLGKHCPENVSHSQKKSFLAHPILHLGYSTPDLRAAAWTAQKAAGRIDPHTIKIIKDPLRRPLPC